MLSNRRLAANILVILFCCGLLAVSCTTDYVTGKKTFSLVSESQEVAMGKDADPQIVAQYGLYDDPDMGAYIDGIGQALAGKSHRPQLEYTFRVLDSEIVNAFALPGGWVYVTRGILANFNSEDELAGVLGHEIGHVVARHGAEQMSRQQIASLGVGLGSVLLEDLDEIVQAAGFGVQLLLLRYSRAQESESDQLGVEYSTKLGYDSHKMAGFFETLDRMSAESGQSLPSFMSTHPDPGDREVRVHTLTDEWRQKVNYVPLNKEPGDYLKRLDGMVYGADPRQGYVDGQVFYHPTLAFQFPVPPEWQLINTITAVFLLSPDKKAIVRMTLSESGMAADAAAEFVEKNGVTVTSRQSKMLNGYPTTILISELKEEDGVLKILSYFVDRNSTVYVFHGYSASVDFDTYSASFRSVMEGFNNVTDSAVLNIQPMRIKIRQAPRSGSLSSIFESLGVDRDDFEELAVLNGRHLQDSIDKGATIKVIGK